MAVAKKLSTRFKADAERLMYRIDMFCMSRIQACDSGGSVIRVLESAGDFFEREGIFDKTYEKCVKERETSEGLNKLVSLFHMEMREARLVWEVMYELLRNAGAPQKYSGQRVFA
jgi:hypothetical protein